MQGPAQGVTFLRHAHLQKYVRDIRRLICDFTSTSEDYVYMIKIRVDGGGGGGGVMYCL